MIETYEDLPKATNEELLDFLREQIFIILEVSNKNYRIVLACFNTILKEIEMRLKKIENKNNKKQ